MFGKILHFGKFLCLLFFCICASLMLSTAVFSAGNSEIPEPMEWGEVPESHWEITEFPDDDDAHSIILGDYGDTYISNRMEVIHTRHLRVKILDVDESDYTEFSVSVYTQGRTESLERIRAQTLNLNPDGSVDSERVRRREFHREESGNFETTTFAFPNVQPGSIVEVTYRIDSRMVPFLRPWDFQHSSPVLVSDYKALVPEELDYMAYMSGYEQFAQSSIDGRTGRVYGPANMFQSDSYTAYHWTLTNAPAIRSEPFITTVSDYKNRVDFQLARYRDGRGMVQNLISTWDDIAEELSGSRSFGREISSNRRMRREVLDMIDGMDNPLEIARFLYDYVAGEIAWNGSYGVAVNDGVSDAWEDKRGTSPEKALLLITLYEIAGIDASPVLISTRNNGKVQWDYPRIAQFNHVLVKVEIDGELYVLDPLFREIPFGMLMPSSLNGAGLVIKGKSASFVEIDAVVGSVKNTRAMFAVAEDGSISGSIVNRLSGYEGVVHRLMIQNQEPEEYFLEEMLSELPESVIDNHLFNNLDDADETLEARVDISNENYTIAAGDMIYLNPFFTERRDENPFRNPIRNFPVEYPYGVQNTYSVTIQIPDGYEIIESPEDRLLQLDNETMFVLQSLEHPNILQLMTRFIRTGTEYSPDVYDELRNYYNDIAEIYNEQVVIQKIPDVETSSSGGDNEAENGTGR